MAEFKFDYKIIGPQEFEDGRKLPQNSKIGQITVNANNLEEAKKKARSLIKESKSYQIFSDNISFDRPKEPSIRIESSEAKLKKIEKKLNKVRGGGGTGALKSIRSGTSLFSGPIKKLFKGGRVDKAIKGGSKDL
tara:strand:- start:48 stop:452 length:405 start_codon:yes stop_codon:yes gene_type:complete